MSADTIRSPVMTTPSVSVVVPTYRRRDNLTAVITPLLDDAATGELIVVVDGCDDGSLELLQGLARSNPALRPVWTINQGGAAARQHGIELATHPVVLLIDDDVIAGPGLVSGHAAHHAQADDLVVLGYMPTRPAPEGARGRFATGLYAQEYEAVCREYERDESMILKKLWGGNVSIRTARLADVPYESGRFSATNHSDRDFGLRAHKSGLRGVFDRELLAQHEHVRPLDAYLRDARRQGEGRVLVHAAHADVAGQLDMGGTIRDLPAPLRVALVGLERQDQVAGLLTWLLRLVTLGAGRLGLHGIELGLAKFLRRYETRAGMREGLQRLELERQDAA
ncbi:hypothetical protein BJF86_02510 [Serinicoccus sp. CNJ-927]|uniref:glycosyltransferase n=1 Tax=Serinicoccus sp. CNJ-927 TaxID=1904970 RepID=UPI000960518D|nr:glycosyltransferase family A protein [Serinicoccus sp. CNJ-927]OLT41898.1 hypothetical protein BJF86_02510 [Serinicoccus sp. CNJ-927]